MHSPRLKKLQDWFEDLNGTLTAFSGGVDSSLVAYLAHKFLGDKAIACISISPSLKRKDYQVALDFSHRFCITLEVIETREVDDPNYYTNPVNRCFYCKNHLYHDLQILGKKYPGYTILNGINTDDLGDYRPGIQAAKQHGVRSPLLECGVSKEQIRSLAKFLELPSWDKPASPCLSSRIPYGQEVSREKLKQIELAEEILNQHGFEDVRVRHFQQEARIEVPPQYLGSLKEKHLEIQRSLRKLGFERCLIDEEGLVSGKLNRNLPLQHG